MKPTKTSDQDIIAARGPALASHMDQCERVYRGIAPIESLLLRECGSCSLCCTAPPIEAQAILPKERAWFSPKPAGDACAHCLKGGGCARYESRPDICKGYACLWACGLTDKPPMDAGVCWTLQPDPTTGLVMAKGHTHDIDAVMRDVDNRRDIRWFMRMHEAAGPSAQSIISAVVIQSPVASVRFDNLCGIPDIMGDVRKGDPMRMTIDDRSTRRAQWSIR